MYQAIYDEGDHELSRGSVALALSGLAAGLSMLARCLGGYLVPTLIGNIIGGVALVAIGAHAEFITAATVENRRSK